MGISDRLLAKSMPPPGHQKAFSRLSIPKETEETIMNNICQACSGFCCETFWIRADKEALDKSEDKTLGGPANAEFIRTNFVRKQSPTSNPETANNFAYTCLKFDKESGMCTAYEERPALCKHFRCNTVRKWQLPTKRDLASGDPIP